MTKVVYHDSIFHHQVNWIGSKSALTEIIHRLPCGLTAKNQYFDSVKTECYNLVLEPRDVIHVYAKMINNSVSHSISTVFRYQFAIIVANSSSLTNICSPKRTSTSTTLNPTSSSVRSAESLSPTPPCAFSTREPTVKTTWFVRRRVASGSVGRKSHSRHTSGEFHWISSPNYDFGPDRNERKLTFY